MALYLKISQSLLKLPFSRSVDWGNGWNPPLQCALFNIKMYSVVFDNSVASTKVPIF